MRKSFKSKQNGGFIQRHFTAKKAADLPSTIFQNLKNGAGFTLIEILVVIGIIAILAAVVLIAINPARQFAQARNSQRVSNVNSILNAIGQSMADNKGLFKCAEEGDTIPATAIQISENDFNLRPCIRPTYIPEIPGDPKIGINDCTDDSCSGALTYVTGYTIEQNDTTKRIKVCAPEAKNEKAISASPPEVCVER